jgi:hypothetical protein
MRVATARPRLDRLDLTISNCLVTVVPPCQLPPTFRWPAAAAPHARLPGRSRTSTLPLPPRRPARCDSPTAARPPRPKRAATDNFQLPLTADCRADCRRPFAGRPQPLPSPARPPGRPRRHPPHDARFLSGARAIPPRTICARPGPPSHPQHRTPNAANRHPTPPPRVRQAPAARHRARRRRAEAEGRVLTLRNILGRTDLADLGRTAVLDLAIENRLPFGD